MKNMLYIALIALLSVMTGTVWGQGEVTVAVDNESTFVPTHILIGNLSASYVSNTDKTVKLKGFWGEPDASKKMVIKIGETTINVTMATVVKKNFVVTIPAAIIPDGCTSISVYHEVYPEPASTVSLSRTLIGIPANWDVTANEQTVQVSGNEATILTKANVVLTPQNPKLVRSVTLKEPIINLDTLTHDTTVRNGWKLTGTLSQEVKISIADGATVTLHNVTISGNLYDEGGFAGLTCLGDATLNISGTNTVKSLRSKYPAIQVAEYKTLTIQGTGILNAGDSAKNNYEGAGIGGGYKIPCGNIVINSGTINAIGGLSSAGIGSGSQSSCGDITINGGTVTATATCKPSQGTGATGIGAGAGNSEKQSSCGNIVINGGIVKATGTNYAAGIGSGYDHSQCGNITITYGVISVTATRGTGATDIIGRGAGSTCGTVTVDEGLIVVDLSSDTRRISSAPEGAIDALFSVSSTKQVYFSKGNLQATCTSADGDGSTQETWTWAFATNQYDYIGNATANNAINGDGSVSTAGKVDLFGWVGASSNWEGAAMYGISNSTTENNYGNQANENLKSDWGNTIGSGWRTLTKDEWVYLFNTRESGSTVNGTNDARYTHATINTEVSGGVNGMILFPDGVTIAGSEATSWGNINGNSSWGTKCTSAQWTALAAKGCVFLPVTGYREGTSFEFGDGGCYWSSTSEGNDNSLSFKLEFYSNALYTTYTYKRFRGLSVRLVKDLTDPVPTKRCRCISLDAVTAGNDLVAKNCDTLTGPLAANVRISIANGAEVTLRNTNINLGSGYDWPGIDCQNDATIILEGTNTVSSGLTTGGGRNWPAIYIASGKTLTIKGDGSLTANSEGGSSYSAGIGAGYQHACGNIIIESGTITAKGGQKSAGIGGALSASCGTITINGGTVVATGTTTGSNPNGAGIGSGSPNSSETVTCGTITIAGGTVTATGGNNAAGIGSGASASCEGISIESTVTKVTATKGWGTGVDFIGAGNGGTCGTVTIDPSLSDVTVDDTRTILRLTTAAITLTRSAMTMNNGTGDEQPSYTVTNNTPTFAEGDEIAVIYKNMSDQTVKAVGTITSGVGTASATFTAGLAEPDNSKAIRYIYPAAMAKATVATYATIDDAGTVDFTKLNSQDGTLATLGSSHDLCTFDAANWTAGEFPNGTLVNKLAIMAITLEGGSGNSDITSSITGMTISDGTNSYSVTGHNSDGHIYVAIRPTTDATLNVTATDGTNNYGKLLTGKTYAANNGYNVNWKMSTLLTWNTSNVFNSDHLNQSVTKSNPSRTFEGITLSLSLGGSNNNSYFTTYIQLSPNTSFKLFAQTDGDSFTFTAPTGKRFTMIEIVGNAEIANFTASGGWTKPESTKIVWSGTASNTVTLASGNGNPSCDNLNSIKFYLEDIPAPTGAINGKFTINSSGDQVYFSQGNLKYNGNNSWSFHTNQYDRVLTANGNLTSYPMDLFCWGNIANPALNGQIHVDGDINLNGDTDWGYNAISNGGNTVNSGWRTLTSSEWKWLLGSYAWNTTPIPGTNCRTSSTVNGVANARFAKAYLDTNSDGNGDVHGIIIFPDSYTHPDGVAAPTGINAVGSTSWYANNYNATDWGKMQTAGAVFLPAAGSRLQDGVEYVSSNQATGKYWSSTDDETTEYNQWETSTQKAYNLDFTEGDMAPCDGTDFRGFGFSVRLVKDVQ